MNTLLRKHSEFLFGILNLKYHINHKHGNEIRFLVWFIEITTNTWWRMWTFWGTPKIWRILLYSSADKFHSLYKSEKYWAIGIEKWIKGTITTIYSFSTTISFDDCNCITRKFIISTTVAIPVYHPTTFVLYAEVNA